MRAAESGWVKIGITCASGRRSLWLRENFNQTQDLQIEEYKGYKFHTLESFELCAGREGDDAYVKIINDGSKQVYDLWNVFITAQYAGQIDND